LTSPEFQFKKPPKDRFSMNPLKLSPLPSMRPDGMDGTSSPSRESFVDDMVVHSLLAGPSAARQPVDRADLALAADDMDFAGWCLPENASSGHPWNVSSRRAAAPVFEEEPGIGEPHRGNHRWWLAGLAGALSTLLFSVLLVTLTSRTPLIADDAPITRIQLKEDRKPFQKSENLRAAPALTGVSGLK
jgi:hypothetical protein